MYVSEDFRADREIVLEAVRNHGEVLESVSEDFRGDREIVQAAVTNNPYAFKYASRELQKDPQLRQRVSCLQSARDLREAFLGLQSIILG